MEAHNNVSLFICVRSAADDATWCRALTEYARACAQAGKPLHGWRVHFQQCGNAHALVLGNAAWPLSFGKGALRSFTSLPFSSFGLILNEAIK